MTEGEFNPDEDGMDDYIDDLDDLIRYLEKEAMRLKECVNNAADQWEFGHAKAFARAYGTVLRRLETLKHLKSPGYNEREYCLRRKASLEEKIKAYSHMPQAVVYLEEELKHIERVLSTLAKDGPVIETQYIDEAICSLVEGSIETFKLQIQRRRTVCPAFLLPGQDVAYCIDIRTKLFWIKKAPSPNGIC